MVQTDTAKVQSATAKQVGKKIFLATCALMAVQVVLRGFGLIEKNIMGTYFGTGDQANAYSAARRIANPVLQLGEQVIMHSFLPPFVKSMRENGEKDAWRLASTVLNIMLILMAVIAVLGFCFTPLLLKIFVPGWVHHHADLLPLTGKLTRVMLLAMIVLAVSSLTYCMLNSYKQFALPASSDLALKGTVLIFAILLAHHWKAYALACGFVIGALAKLLMQSGGLGKRLKYYRPVIDLKNPGLKQFFVLALPLIVGWGFSTFRNGLEILFLSYIPEQASLSAFDYAKTLCDPLVTFIPYAFGIALFPFLADIAVEGDKERLRDMLLSATRMMILIFVPLSLAIIIFRYPIILSLYGSKEFTMHSVDLTAAPLLILAVGMLFSALEIIVNQFYFAMSDTIRPTVTGMVMLPVYFFIGYFGVTSMAWGAAAVALAMLCYRAAKVFTLYTMIRKKVGGLGGSNLPTMLMKLALAIIPFVIILVLAGHYIPSPEHAEGKVRKLLAIMPYMVTGGVGVAIYLAILHYLRVDEVAMLVGKVRGKLLRKPSTV